MCPLRIHLGGGVGASTFAFVASAVASMKAKVVASTDARVVAVVA